MRKPLANAKKSIAGRTDRRTDRPTDRRTDTVPYRSRSTRQKVEILKNAKRLKNIANWTRMVITHDLTKLQCKEEKIQELKLRKEADEKNSSLSTENKNTEIWKVVGG